MITWPDTLDAHFCKFQLHTKSKSPTEAPAVPLTVAHKKDNTLGKTQSICCLSLTMVSNKCLRKEHEK